MKIKEIKTYLSKLRLFWRWLNKSFPLKSEFGTCGANTVLQYPMRVYCTKDVYVSENVKLSSGLHIINAPGEKVIIKRNSVLAADCTIVTNSHRSTVTIPQFLLGASHVNDKSADVIINEDVWVGVNVTILAGVELGRGCIVSANSLVTKSVPPYALVVGSPARVVKKIFSVDQILKHEQVLYPENERYTKEFLESLFEKYYQGVPTYGTDEGITEEASKRIIQVKKHFHYISTPQ